jgi:membrane protein YdbS with pleckstrin-like domain
MGQNATPATPAPIAALRTLATALISAVVMFGLVALFVVGPDGYPPVWVAAALGALAVAAHVAVEAVGYRVPAVPPGTQGEEAAAAGLAAYRSSMMLRFALCEAVAIIALAASFVVEPQTAKTYLVGGTLSLALLLWHVWPSERITRRLETQLDRDGGHSGLAAALHGRRAGSALL